MSVIRVNLNKCTGCKNCVDVCPMDVFYFSDEAHRSVLAYPENCQSCGQCYLNCEGGSLGISNDMYGYAVNALRCLTTAPQNRIDVTLPGTFAEIASGMLSR